MDPLAYLLPAGTTSNSTSSSETASSRQDSVHKGKRECESSGDQAAEPVRCTVNRSGSEYGPATQQPGTGEGCRQVTSVPAAKHRFTEEQRGSKRKHSQAVNFETLAKHGYVSSYNNAPAQVLMGT